MAERLELVVALRPGGEEVAGTLRAPGSDDQSFEGWLELLVALEHAVAAPAGQSEAQPRVESEQGSKGTEDA